MTVTAVDGGAAEGADGNGITVVLVDDARHAGGVDSVAYDDGTNTLTVDRRLHAARRRTRKSRPRFKPRTAVLDFTAVATARRNTNAGRRRRRHLHADLHDRPVATPAARRSSVTADTAGAAANGVTVTIAEDSTIANNTVRRSINGQPATSTSRVRGTVTKAAIVAAIDGLAGYSADDDVGHRRRQLHRAGRHASGRRHAGRRRRGERRSRPRRRVLSSSGADGLGSVQLRSRHVDRPVGRRHQPGSGRHGRRGDGQRHDARAALEQPTAATPSSTSK